MLPNRSPIRAEDTHTQTGNAKKKLTKRGCHFGYSCFDCFVSSKCRSEEGKAWRKRQAVVQWAQNEGATGKSSFIEETRSGKAFLFSFIYPKPEKSVHKKETVNLKITTTKKERGH